MVEIADMPQSLAKVLLHVTFGTKNRVPFIQPAVQPKLFAYLAGVCRANGSEAFRVGGTEDHVHIACTLPRTLTLSDLLEETKKASSAWVKRQDPDLRDFAWQAGYGAFSLGQLGPGRCPGLICSALSGHDTRLTFLVPLRQYPGLICSALSRHEGARAVCRRLRTPAAAALPPASKECGGWRWGFPRPAHGS